MQNKRKIINDPIYGFIQIPSELMFDIISHPLFQRLRRIKQLGLTYYVYPGAMHTRFQHVLGAAHLMKEAINILRQKGHDITDEEAEASLIAILLHDIGHGPFSHTLESSFFKNVPHETVSLSFMKQLNTEFSGKLNTGIEVFTGTYEKKFLHQLVSSQLDMDRLDYLRRDSFYTGVSEGVIGSERIIKMLNIVDNELVIEEKGIYSIEKFLIARRLMYWQVYLHKTVISSEQMLIKLIQRARFVFQSGVELFLTPALKFFFSNSIKDANALDKIIENSIPLEEFSKLDDYDIITCIKEWQFAKDKILSFLSKSLVNRNLYKVEIQSKPFHPQKMDELKNELRNYFNFTENEEKYYLITDTIKNNAYSKNLDERINILLKNGMVEDIAIASDVSNISALSKPVEKYFVCYPKVF
ncbi:MAG: HD domain-containing protein [Bacteroidales bacterium]